MPTAGGDVVGRSGVALGTEQPCLGWRVEVRAGDREEYREGPRHAPTLGGWGASIFGGGFQLRCVCAELV